MTKTNKSIKEIIRSRLKEMAATPKNQIKQLAIGTAISIVAILAMMLVSFLEIQWLFYGFSLLMIAGVLYAIPGYIGVWVWRMKGVIFKNDSKQ